MKQFLAVLTAFWVSMFPSSTPADLTMTTTPLDSSVLGVADESLVFRVNIPAIFSEAISAPNVVYSLKSGNGIQITNGTGSDSQSPIISTNAFTSLVAGTGITVEGNKITSNITQGYTSLEAGTGISIDGNKITNTLSIPTPDYTQSGWTKTGTTIGLTTLTDSVTMGAVTTGALTASSIIVNGISVLSGNVTIGNGVAILPNTDLGSDLGSSTYRFNNLWVANINSNSSQSFSGQTTFSYPPADTTIDQASVLINPTSSIANGQLLGLGIAGYQRALIDEDGDLILGYNSLTSAPPTDYPLDIYGHSGTRVSFVDTSGNLTIGGTANQGKLSFGGSSQYIRESSGLWYFTGLAGEELTIDLNAGSGSALSIAQGDFIIDNNANNEDIYLKVTKAGVDTTALAIQGSSGNVGIGTTSPTTLFQVGGAVNGNRKAQIDLNGLATFSYRDNSVVNNVTLANIYPTNSGSNLRYMLGDDTNLYEAGGIRVVGEQTWSSTASTRDSFMAFYTGLDGTSAEKLRINSSGNVGIGTTNPLSALHVAGTTGINWNGAAGAVSYGLATIGTVGTGGSLFVNTPSLSTDWASGLGITGSYSYPLSVVNINAYGVKGNPVTGYGADLAFSTAKGTTLSEWLRITKDGNVGIGTTSPTQKLTLGSGYLHLQPGDVSGGIIFGTAEPNSAVYEFKIESANRKLTFKTDHVNSGPSWANTLLTLDSATNNVGIGTTSPTSKLSIGTTGTADEWLGLGGAAGQGIVFGNNVGLIDYRTSYFDFNSYSGYFAFTTGVHEEKVRITNAGNVGIGTTSPSYPLEVNGTTKATTFLSTGGFSLSNTGLSIGGSFVMSNMASTFGNMKLVSSSSGAGVNLLFNSPADTLKIRNLANNADGNLTAGGITASSLTTGTVYSNAGVLTNTDPSDINLKTNVLNLPDGTLDKVLGLRTVSYNWKSTGDGAIGFIAQEVQGIFPELVGTNSDGSIGLYTTQFIPLLAKAIQEQQLQIDEVKLSTMSAGITKGEWDSTNNLIQVISDKLSEFINSIKNKFRTKEICLGEEGNETCVTKEQLDTLIKLIPSPEASSSATPSPSPSASLSTSPEPSFEPSPSASAAATPTLTPMQ